MKNSLLMLIKHLPYATYSNQEALDLAMVAASCDMSCSLLFLDQGVWCLAKQQQADLIQRKSIAKLLTGLQSLGINQFFIAKHDMDNYKLTSKDLICDCTLLNAQQIQQLFLNHDVMINY